MDFKSHPDGIVQQNEKLEVELKVILIKSNKITTLAQLIYIKTKLKSLPICGRQFRLFQTQVAWSKPEVAPLLNIKNTFCFLLYICGINVCKYKYILHFPFSICPYFQSQYEW